MKFKPHFSKELAKEYIDGDLQTQSIMQLTCSRRDIFPSHLLFSYPSLNKEHFAKEFGEPSRKRLPFEGSPSLHFLKSEINNKEVTFLLFGDSKTSSKGSSIEIISDENLYVDEIAASTKALLEHMLMLSHKYLDVDFIHFPDKAEKSIPLD